MDPSTSPVIIASFISVIAGFFLTQIIGPVLDHYRDKHYRLLERNLQLRKLIGDDFKNDSLDEIIRMQLNSYILVSRSSERKSRSHRFVLSLVTLAGWIFAVTSFLFFADHSYVTGSVFAILVPLSILVYFGLRKRFFRSYTVENTKYRAAFLGGKFEGGQAPVDIMPVNEDGTLTSLDYPVLYIKDKLTGRIHAYNRAKSSGNISIGSGEETDMQTDYIFHKTISILPEILHNSKVLSSVDVKLPGEIIPIEDLALASVKPMRKMWTLIQRLLKKLRTASSPDSSDNLSTPA